MFSFVPIFTIAAITFIKSVFWLKKQKNKTIAVSCQVSFDLTLFPDTGKAVLSVLHFFKIFIYINFFIVRPSLPSGSICGRHSKTVNKMRKSNYRTYDLVGVNSVLLAEDGLTCTLGTSPPYCTYQRGLSM